MNILGCGETRDTTSAPDCTYPDTACPPLSLPMLYLSLHLACLFVSVCLYFSISLSVYFAISLCPSISLTPPLSFSSSQVLPFPLHLPLVSILALAVSHFSVSVFTSRHITPRRGASTFTVTGGKFTVSACLNYFSEI